MIAVALCITAVGVVLLILGAAVPQLRGQVTLQTNDENPNGIAVCLCNHSYQCNTVFHFSATWAQRRIFHLDMLWLIYSSFLLEDLNILLPCDTSNHWNNVGISDKKGQVPRSE